MNSKVPYQPVNVPFWSELALFTRKDNDTVKPVLSCHSKKGQKLGVETDYCLMQVKSIAECSNGSILQYFRPSLSYHLSLRSVCCLFLSGPLSQVVLYSHFSFTQRTNDQSSHFELKVVCIRSCWHIGFVVTKPVFRFLTKRDSNQSPQLQILARKLKFLL